MSAILTRSPYPASAGRTTAGFPGQHPASLLNAASLLLSVLALQWSAVAGVQARPEPRPDQTTRVTATQELALSMRVAGSAGEPRMAQLVSESLIAYKQVNGRFDDQGRMEAQLTIERFDVKQSLNGMPRKTNNPDDIVGRSLTAVLDRTGKLLDLKVPKEVPQGALLKQLVAAAYAPAGQLPEGEMAVGVTETKLSTIPLRMAGMGAETYRTNTTTVLEAVEKSGENRVARFQQRIESAPGMELVKVNGTGTVDVNLDRGFVIKSTMEWTFEGAAGSARASSSSTPASPVQGKYRVIVLTDE